MSMHILLVSHGAEELDAETGHQRSDDEKSRANVVALCC